MQFWEFFCLITESKAVAMLDKCGPLIDWDIKLYFVQSTMLRYILLYVVRNSLVRENTVEWQNLTVYEKNQTYWHYQLVDVQLINNK